MGKILWNFCTLPIDLTKFFILGPFFHCWWHWRGYSWGQNASPKTNWRSQGLRYARNPCRRLQIPINLLPNNSFSPKVLKDIFWGKPIDLPIRKKSIKNKYSWMTKFVSMILSPTMCAIDVKRQILPLLICWALIL